MNKNAKKEDLIEKWTDLKEQAEEAKQEADYAGQSKEHSSAMGAYIKTFQLFIDDLHKL